MRQIFSSPRLENVEGVEKLLKDAGIETKLSAGRSYKQFSRREFSYVPGKQDASAQQPSIWVVKSDDYKRARELLHGAGLLDEAKTGSYAPAALQFKDAPKPPLQARISRMRLALLFVAGGFVFWTVVRMLLAG